MTKNHFIIFAGLICLSLPSFSEAAQNCADAEKSLPTYQASKKMFGELFDFYKSYGSCLDGDLAERTAAVVTDSLDQAWGQLAELDNLIKKDKGFKKFIFNNVEPSVTSQEAEVKRIIHHAKKECPHSLKGLCRELVKKSEASLKSE